MQDRDEFGRFASTDETLAREHASFVCSVIQSRGSKHSGLVSALDRELSGVTEQRSPSGDELQRTPGMRL